MNDTPYAFQHGDLVEKCVGEARWYGEIVSTYDTMKGKPRYVVDVLPQGFQMIATGAQLRRAQWNEYRHSLSVALNEIAGK